uniref:Uncharacterized protein n=1 Tax=Sphaerodactylus townsendi TaxID=933632 RepID=A0ACB8EM54_9SAUR
MHLYVESHRIKVLLSHGQYSVSYTNKFIQEAHKLGMMKTTESPAIYLYYLMIRGTRTVKLCQSQSGSLEDVGAYILSHTESDQCLSIDSSDGLQLSSQAVKIIAELKTTISSLTEEGNQQQLAAERRLQDVLQRFEDEKQQLIRDNDRAIKSYQYTDMMHI